MVPRNEMEVVALFCQQAHAAGFEIISMQTVFPDAILKRGEVEYKVEFEFKASNFWAHKHNPTMCDLVICWINDDEYPVLPILELSNPDWAEVPIIPPPYRERLAGHWKSRALAAENKVKELEARVTKSNVRASEFIKAVWFHLELAGLEKAGRTSFTSITQYWSKVEISQEEMDLDFSQSLEEFIKKTSEIRNQ